MIAHDVFPTTFSAELHSDEEIMNAVFDNRDHRSARREHAAAKRWQEILTIWHGSRNASLHRRIPQVV